MDHLKEVRKELRENLERAQQGHKRNFDRRAKPAPSFQVGDLVWLNRKNIETKRPSAKLDVKRFGPFRVKKVVGESKMAFELELPPQWRIHPVFHAHLLDPYHANKLEGRKQPIPEQPEIVDGVPEYEVVEILDSRIRYGKLWYFVDWKGYKPEERTWEPAENVTNADELVASYHRRHPQRPSTADVPANRPRRSSGTEGGDTVTEAPPTPPRHSTRIRHRT